MSTHKTRLRMVGEAAGFTRHVDDGGSDTTGDGLSAGTAWATLGKFYDYLCDNVYLMPGVTATCQIGDGTLTVANNNLWLITRPWNGPGNVVINGNSTTPGNVILQNTGSASDTIDIASAVHFPGTLTFQNMRGLSTRHWLRHQGTGRVIAGGKLEAGNCGGSFLHMNYNGTLEVPTTAAVTVIGDSAGLIDVDSGYCLYFPATTVLSGSRTITEMFISRWMGRLSIVSAFSGTLIGKPYTVKDGARILHDSSAGALPVGSGGSNEVNGGMYIDRNLSIARTGDTIFNAIRVGAPTGGMPGTGSGNFAGDVKKNNVNYTNP